MKVLAIETSCDETGLALIEAENNNIKVLANLVHSQIAEHAPYGGVVPNIAKREHIKILPLLWNKIEGQGLDSNIDAIAVTQGPGLEPCLWAGITFAQNLANELEVPLYGINHLKGHVYIVFPYAEVTYPILALIVSGGHTELVFSKSPGHFEILGRTKDDAAGEAFDKVAKLLGLGYPGGPEISRHAERGNPTRFNFPRPMINAKDFDFSFSGLKTAVVYTVKGIPNNLDYPGIELSDRNIADVAASFQQAVVDVLVTKTIRAAKAYRPKTIILGGGVAANKLLRSELTRNLEVELPSAKLILPDPKLTTDNALMIALAAYYEHNHLQPKRELQALPNWRIDEG
jgi:N6-L-threonylcarbamoyladenine synthase